MPEVSAKDVMALRNETGLPMMACKEALVEAGGDRQAAVELLRQRLKSRMDQRVGRAAGEGRIAIAIREQAGAAAIVELRAESDFTARNEQFVDAAQRVAQIALEHGHAGDVPALPEITAIVDQLRMSTGENCSYARGHKVIGETGTTAFGSYVHHDGKLGVLIQAEGDISDERLRELCMHVAAVVPTPMGISRDDIPAAIVDRERATQLDRARQSGKPPQIIERIVDGAMQKFFAEVALLEQRFIRDDSKTVGEILGPRARIIAFYRWAVGETG